MPPTFQPPPTEQQPIRQQPPPAKKLPNFFYYDEDGTKRGPLTPQQVKDLAARGTITAETVMETDNGYKGKAGQIKGLFGNPPSPQAVPVPPVAAAPPVAAMNATPVFVQSLQTVVMDIWTILTTKSLTLARAKQWENILYCSCCVTPIVAFFAFLRILGSFSNSPPDDIVTDIISPMIPFILLVIASFVGAIYSVLIQSSACPNCERLHA
jgi:hypothetical protein